MSEDYGTKYRTARDRILHAMLDLEWHDWTELRRVGGLRYGARLLELKRLGYRIEAQSNADHGRRYRLKSRTPGEPQRKRVKVLLEETDARDLLAGRVTLTACAALRDALGSYASNAGKL